MAHDVFISYSSKDKPIADAICNNLEGAGIRCWIAPRDIAPGEDWPTAITRAISQSCVMVLVFSAHSNSSEHVSRELFLAADHKLVIIPFKIDNVQPEPGLQYYLARTHWLDALNPPTQEQINLLVNRVNSIVPATQKEEKKEPVKIFPEAQPQPVTPPVPETPPAQETHPKRSRSRWRWLWILGILLIISGLAIWFFVDNPLGNKKVVENSPTFTHTLDFAAKISGFGGTLYEGPGENYPVIGPVLADVKIIAKVEGCAWLAVTTSTDSKSGWIKANQLTYSVACADIPPAQIPPTPTLDFTAKIKDRGVPLYEGPGDTYPLIGVVLADVQIVGQTDGCEWLKVDSRAFKKVGWLEAGKMNFSVTCAEISALP
jgi:hypothetical protein